MVSRFCWHEGGEALVANAFAGSREAGDRARAGGHQTQGILAMNAAGLALAYVGWPIATSGEVCGPRDTLLADGSSLVVLAPALVLLVVLHHTKINLSSQAVNALAVGSALIECGALGLLGALHLAGLCTETARFALCVTLAAATFLNVACWLRRARGASLPLATIYVFTAVAMNAALEFILKLLPGGWLAVAAALIVLLQLPLRRLDCPTADTGEPVARDDDYYAFMMSGSANRRFLAACALGLAAIALVAGFLCGFPDDQAHDLGTGASAIALALTAALCWGIIGSTLRGKSRTMTVGIWVIMELLAALALVLYNGFPADREVGAVTAQLLNAVMTGFVWHLIIALMTSGWRDPLYYATAAWLLWLGGHDLGRIMLLVLPIGGGNHFTGSVISLLLVISTQIILVKLIDVIRPSHGETGLSQPPADGEQGAAGREDAPAPSALERFLGLDEDAAGDAHRSMLEDKARQMGRQFMLSDREVEVLTLYAMGFTQRRVAEELFISTTTAHTHITRIYAKTNLHSRQELLDFMHQS